jgi:exonuclease SbcC
MRPEFLEVSGFTAFRDPVTVDFRDADLFALTGPTGSGKSSLIDAIVFSLYGSVPRIGQRDVAPIISLGKLEARVRFQFSLDGVHYTVARVVRRTKSGASTAEARLEQDGEVLAGNADEVTERIGSLLGLGFDHFTKSVVLPQGQFAAFLHDRPADRQKLLRDLLDLSVYEHMRELAKQRRIAAETRVQGLQTQLEALAHATREAEQQTAQRLERLEALRDEIEKTEPELKEIQHQIDSLNESVDRGKSAAKQLERIEIPDQVAGLADRLIAARQAAADADRAAGAAGERLQAAEEAQAALPAGLEVDRIIEQHEALAEERQNLTELRKRLAKAQREADEAAAALGTAGDDVVGARAALEKIRQDHAAHALAASLAAGEPCPVCRQLVDELPVGEVPPVLEDAEALLGEAIGTENEARRTEQARTKHLAAEQARLAGLEDRIDKLEETLSGGLDLEAARRAKEAVSAAVTEGQRARGEADATTAAFRAAQKSVAALESDISEARRRFDQTRDGLAMLEPPMPVRENLADDWAQLAAWAQTTVGKLKRDAAASERTVEQLRVELSKREGAIRTRADKEGIGHEDRPIRDVVVAATASVAHDLTGLRKDMQLASEHRSSLARNTEEAELARALGRHLSATGFEAWLMEEALAALVTGANLLLDDLAGGAYSLEVVKRDFRVIDHRNANERRQVKTLSGGETFLVSLALALSLAEQLASMSVHGGSRLESVFLDEGFGTLDVETLDTVAHVIQELGARGRTVGIVTHVRDLAEQVPVRFEVRKGVGTATVDRVEL